MSKLNTKDLPESTGASNKILQPGNCKIKINSIELKKEPFEGDPYNIILNCEGEDMGEGFEGFAYDKNDLSKGKAKGPVAKVRASEYSFQDREFEGKKFFRDIEILKWFKGFCKAIGKIEWCFEQDDKFDTIEKWVENLNHEKPYDGIWLDSCLAGRAYTNKQGFLNYDLYLPYFNNKGIPLEVSGTTPSKLVTFNQTIHIKQPKPAKKAEIVDEFSAGADQVAKPKKASKSSDADFDIT